MTVGPWPDPLERVRARVWQQIRAGRVPDSDLVDELADAERATLGAYGARALSADLTAAVAGAGPLEQLLGDPHLTDLAVNGDGRVWVDRGAGMELRPERLGGPEELRALAVRLAAQAGRRLDESAPCCDGVLPSGVRVHAVLPPVVSDGAHLTLRVPARHRPSLSRLCADGLCPPSWEPVLRGLVIGRASLLITGGTGAGKTTLLAALLAEADQRERLVVVEDVRELAIDHAHVVHLQGRSPNVEGAGSVTMVALVREALRMRPDRIVVGEVRGAEVRELLMALNTGHEGGCGTVHANAPADVVARLEALGALAGLGRGALHAQLLSAVQAVVHVHRVGRARRISSISVIVRGRDGRAQIRPALEVAGATQEVPVFSGGADDSGVVPVGPAASAGSAESAGPIAPETRQEAATVTDIVDWQAWRRLSALVGWSDGSR